MNILQPNEKLRQIFESTIDSGLSYDGNINEIDFYSLFCKSTANNNLYKLLSSNLSMFKCKFENEDSILIVFSLPVNLNSNVSQQDNKHISERIMDILKAVEECFTTVDFMDLKNLKEDKFVYMVVIKKIKEGE